MEINIQVKEISFDFIESSVLLIKIIDRDNATININLQTFDPKVSDHLHNIFLAIHPLQKET